MQPTKASFSHSQGLIDETIETGGVNKMLHIYPMCGILHFPSIDPDTLHFLAKYHSSGHNVKMLHNGHGSIASITEIHHKLSFAPL